MANILDLQTVGDGYIAKVDADPAATTGTAAPIGTIAQWNTGTEGRAYLKTGAADTAWDRMSTYAVSGFVQSGNALRLALYPSTGNVVDDQALQNSQNVSVKIANQPTRTAAIEYQIPNPGDALTAADFVLTEGSQTINGAKQFTGDITILGNFDVQGTVTFLDSQNTLIKDKLITLNDQGPTGSTGGTGFEIEENNLISGYFKTDNVVSPTGWLIKAPYSQELKIDQSLMTASRTVTVQDKAGQLTLQTAGLTLGSVPYVNTNGLLIQDNTRLFFDDTNKRLGVGLNAPTETFHVAGSTTVTGVGNKIKYYADSKKETSQATVSTTDGTVTSLQAIAVPTNSEMHVRTTIVARKTAGAGSGTTGDGAVFVREARYKNVGGTVTVYNVQSSYTSRDVAAWNATLDVSGTNARLAVNGSANNTMKWDCTTEIVINS